MSDLTRRDLLQGAGAGAGAAAIALGGSGVALAARRRRATLSGLAKELRGTLMTPSSRGWSSAAQVWNPYAQVQPRAIAFCESARDVAEVIRFARRSGWPIAARSGRHSFAGYCNVPGIVADVSRIDGVTVNAAAGTVTVGAGLDVLGAYERLILAEGLAIPTGTCPTVGLGGLVLGGGVSRVARQVGMTADNLTAATVVLPSGEIVRCDADRDADLFWALRGGGGGNFGVATSFTLRSFPATGDVLTFAMSFPWSQAAEVLSTWQQTIPQAPAELGGCTYRAANRPAFAAAPNGDLSVFVAGGWAGTQADMEDVLAPLVALGPINPRIGPLPFAQVWMPDYCSLGPGNAVSCPTTLYPNYQASDFLDGPLPPAAIDTLLQATESWPGGVGGQQGGLQIEAFGGAINRVPAGATAFVHRDNQSHMSYLNFWGPQNPPSVARANVRWLDGLYAAMRPYVSGYAYQNYIDPKLKTWQHAYYGANYPRLQRIKAQVDPDDLFAFRQGIQPRRRRQAQRVASP